MATDRMAKSTVTLTSPVPQPPTVLTYTCEDILLQHIVKPSVYGSDLEPSPICATWPDPQGLRQRCPCGAIEWEQAA